MLAMRLCAHTRHVSLHSSSLLPLQDAFSRMWVALRTTQHAIHPAPPTVRGIILLHTYSCCTLEEFLHPPATPASVSPLPPPSPDLVQGWPIGTRGHTATAWLPACLPGDDGLALARHVVEDVLVGVLAVQLHVVAADHHRAVAAGVVGGEGHDLQPRRRQHTQRERHGGESW